MYLDVCERDTSRYKQDTCKIHHDTTGYVSDRKSPPKTIGNPRHPGRDPLMCGGGIIKAVPSDRPV